MRCGSAVRLAVLVLTCGISWATGPGALARSDRSDGPRSGPTSGATRGSRWEPNPARAPQARADHDASNEHTVPTRPLRPSDVTDHDAGDADTDDDTDGSATVKGASVGPPAKPGALDVVRVRPRSTTAAAAVIVPVPAAVTAAVPQAPVTAPTDPHPVPNPATALGDDTFFALPFSTSADDGRPGLVDGTIIALYSILGLGTAILAGRALRGRDRRLAAVRADAERITFE